MNGKHRILVLCCAFSIIGDFKKIWATDTTTSTDFEETGESKRIEIRLMSVEVEEIDAFKMEVRVRFDLEQTWILSEVDRSMSNDTSERPNSKGQGHDDDLWPPQVYAANGRETRISRTMKWNSNSATGQRYTVRDTVAVRMGCLLDFSMYPFDHQRCTVDLRSKNVFVQFTPWGHGRNLSKEENPHQIESRIFVSPFSIVRIASSIQDSKETGNVNERMRKFVVHVHSRRNYGAYFGSYFVPISFFVFISLLTLWLVYPKISVIVNFMNIIIVNIFLVIHGSGLDIPKVYYATAMSVNSAVAILFIVLVLLVNVYVLYYIKCEEEDDEEKARRRRAYDLNIRSDIKFIPPSLATTLNRGGSVEDDLGPTTSNNSHSPSTWVILKQKFMDRVRRNSHWALLSTYLLFVFVFWITMLSIHYLQ